MSHQSPETSPDLLATIVAATHHIVRERMKQCSEAVVRSQARGMVPGGDRFLAALQDPGINVIAECKRRSPSRGILCADYQPDRIAASYETHGAAAVSVLTEPTFFDGTLDHLRAVRAAVNIPVLRKDFIVTPYQVYEAVGAGADAVLLIVAALDDKTLGGLFDLATTLGLGVLMEVHDSVELGRARQVGAPVVGVNNRNLRTLAVDLQASRRLIGEFSPDTVGVAESGLKTRADLIALRTVGYRAFLIGETLIATENPGRTLAGLLAEEEHGSGNSESEGLVNVGDTQ